MADVFFNSTHSLFGNPTMGDGSAIISFITTSYLSWAGTEWIMEKPSIASNHFFIYTILHSGNVVVMRKTQEYLGKIPTPAIFGLR
jgi:hypothetical protein